MTSIIRHAAILTGLILASSSIYINPAQSQQRACVITDQGATVCGKPTTSKKKTQETTQNNQNTESSQEFRLNDYVFSLKKCQRDLRVRGYSNSGKSAKCDITVVNNGVERNLNIITSGQRSRSEMTMTDATGDKYTADANFTRVGERKGRKGEEVTFKTTRGNSYDLSVTFFPAPESIKKADKLLLSVAIDDGTRMMVQFTDVDIKPGTEER